MIFKAHLVILSILSTEQWQQSNVAVRTNSSVRYEGNRFGLSYC